MESRIISNYKNKKFGQNFLQNEKICIDIVNLLNIDSKDHVVEIGPGYGALTKHINEKCKLSLIEIDEEICWFSKQYKAKIYNKDFLYFDLSRIIDLNENNKVISNLPFNISKIIIKRIILEYYNVFSCCVLMLQQEVMDTILQRTSAFGIFVSTFFQLSNPIVVSRHFFEPKPRVNGKVCFFKPLLPKILDPQKYLNFLFDCHKAKRKILKNNIENCPVEIENLRPHQLSNEQFINIYNTHGNK